MQRFESADLDDSLDVEGIRSVLREHPVRFAVLFGSHATGMADGRSDVDIAIELADVDATDPGYNDAFLGLSADLSTTLGTDDVDVVDVHRLAPSMATAVFDRGVFLFGDEGRVAELRGELDGGAPDVRSPRDRIDAALARIDAHFDDFDASDDDGVPAAGDPGDGR